MRWVLSGRQTWLWATGLVLSSFTALGLEPLLHGMPLDERNRLEIKQIGGHLTISLISRNRLPLTTPWEVDGHQVQRVTERTELATINSEVLVPAAPNYLSNPGDLYRITVDGVCFTPPYHSVREVKAEEARAYLYSEFVKLQGRLDGIPREAMRRAAGVSLAVLNKAGRLPGELSTTVLRSKAGITRFGGEKLEKRKTTVAPVGWKTSAAEQGLPDLPPGTAQPDNEKGIERK